MPAHEIFGLDDAVREALVFPTMRSALVYLMGHQNSKDITRFGPCVTAYAVKLSGKSIVIPRNSDLVLGIRAAGGKSVTGTLRISGDHGGWSGPIVLPFGESYVPPIGRAYPVPLVTLQFHDTRLEFENDDTVVEVLYGALDTETRRTIATNTVVAELENCVMSTGKGAVTQQVDVNINVVGLPDLSDVDMSGSSVVVPLCNQGAQSHSRRMA